MMANVFQGRRAELHCHFQIEEIFHHLGGGRVGDQEDSVGATLHAQAAILLFILPLQLGQRPGHFLLWEA